MFAPYEQVYLFMERGGDVLYAIMAVIFLLWLFILERLAFFSFTYRPQLANAVAEWEARGERTSWHAHQVRTDLISGVEMALEANMTTIKMLVGLCPLFGLLGTVTGMIEVFDIMAYLGSGSPKAMASGISKATIPTMAGMVAALSGLFANTYLQRVVSREQQLLEDQLTSDH